FQAITPFLHLPDVDGDKDYAFNQQNNGELRKMLLPFIQEMSKLDSQGVRRELLIPIVTKGNPHHWNLCLLSINENNIPSLHYIESLDAFNLYSSGIDDTFYG